jgi:hypothetical protein
MIKIKFSPHLGISPQQLPIKRPSIAPLRFPSLAGQNYISSSAFLAIHDTLEVLPDECDVILMRGINESWLKRVNLN